MRYEYSYVCKMSRDGGSCCLDLLIEYIKQITVQLKWGTDYKVNHIWFGYEVPRMILLCNLEPCNLTVIKTCLCMFQLPQLWFQCINVTCVEVVALIRCVFLNLIIKMSDQLSEQWINIQFCVKLSLEMKHRAFNVILKANGKVCNRNSWHPHNPRKVTCWNCNEDNAHQFLWYQGYCLLSIHSTRPYCYPSLLHGNTEVVMWICV